ncbi:MULTISPECIES: helix-turn-helix domain-containing protein [Burkholderia cepacia complex]|uniref:helix-turn-helix domain-containing protein n=1 Tax=Burkholderia cepacia complex TaxID=87882 RepID=UPI0022EB35E0|nr:MULTISPECIES: helix-turn-helix domain-containing protein [Burkholderia cepacia complex]MDA3672170.1 helix-turn-helix domain-containing protein [Burkholderia cenocepacia]MDA3681475.1 helix-turn-helix domain-containing protein [Burkholderia cenocepacia]MDA3689088.1 helix-turn-helix domain-containing protein [Burkholderia cenocepacia]MDA3696479.1 helix-turn-helix domain-containing protein [Burkholderia cenocepacia]MDA3703870.1 helix-turn-helix domain-containing protein [Burkholderia cenocepaci
MKSIDRFDDVYAHAASVKHWNQTYSQISAGSLESSLMQLTSARYHLFRERINQRVVQHGEAPAGKLCFAVPIYASGSSSMQGRKADCNSIFFLRGGEEFMFHMPTGMDMLSINFELDMFESALSTIKSAHEIKTLLKQPVIKLPAQRLATCRRRLLAIFTEAFFHDEINRSQDRDEELGQAILRELLQLICSPDCNRLQRNGSSTQSFIVEKCHLLAMSERINVPSVMEMCRRLQVSRRTVQNSFRSVTETTPLNYLRSIRLNGVRRSLISTHPSNLSIGDAAARWGFFHPSHFAADYQELFGELPSRTRRQLRQDSWLPFDAFSHM